MPDGPEWTATLDIAYTFRAGAGRVIPRAGLNISIGVLHERRQHAVPTAGRLHAHRRTLAYETDDGRWRFTAYGQNLSDEIYFNGGFADLVDQGYAEVAVARPREYGLTVQYRY